MLEQPAAVRRCAALSVWREVPLRSDDCPVCAHHALVLTVGQRRATRHRPTRVSVWSSALSLAVPHSAPNLPESVVGQIVSLKSFRKKFETIPTIHDRFGIGWRSAREPGRSGDSAFTPPDGAGLSSVSHSLGATRHGRARGRAVGAPPCDPSVPAPQTSIGPRAQPSPLALW